MTEKNIRLTTKFEDFSIMTQSDGVNPKFGCVFAFWIERLNQYCFLFVCKLSFFYQKNPFLFSCKIFFAELFLLSRAVFRSAV
jgi:hypothetical protein